MKVPPFERLMASLDQPMVVVTAATRRAVAGCLVGFSAQCGSDPPRYCVFIAKANPAYDVMRRAGHVMVHFLDRRQADVATAFETGATLGGGDVEDGLPLPWRPGPDGRTPRLTAIDTWVFGRVVGRHDIGDHVAFVLDPLRERVPRRVRPLGSQQVRGGKPARSG
jgi:flavin reductase (DIM6/NTAB) family NADH-FMN oxidoreductase RutF